MHLSPIFSVPSGINSGEYQRNVKGLEYKQCSINFYCLFSLFVGTKIMFYI